MSSPYKRRKPSLIRNVWVYRYLIASAVVMGLLLWFVLVNNAPVEVRFPFGLLQFQSTAGVVILLSAMTGSILTGLVLGLMVALRRLKASASHADDEEGKAVGIDDRPPSDYASKTPEGFSDAPWSRPKLD
ncbi:hypothetical protein BH23PLA1_BH23PLA1_32300 [soil metagenome]